MEKSLPTSRKEWPKVRQELLLRRGARKHPCPLSCCCSPAQAGQRMAAGRCCGAGSAVHCGACSSVLEQWDSHAREQRAPTGLSVFCTARGWREPSQLLDHQNNLGKQLQWGTGGQDAAGTPSHHLLRPSGRAGGQQRPSARMQAVQWPHAGRCNCPCIVGCGTGCSGQASGRRARPSHSAAGAARLQRVPPRGTLAALGLCRKKENKEEQCLQTPGPAAIPSQEGLAGLGVWRRKENKEEQCLQTPGKREQGRAVPLDPGKCREHPWSGKAGRAGGVQGKREHERAVPADPGFRSHPWWGLPTGKLWCRRWRLITPFPCWLLAISVAAAGRQHRTPSAPCWAPGPLHPAASLGPFVFTRVVFFPA